jgi:hypothetical protein
MHAAGSYFAGIPLKTRIRDRRIPVTAFSIRKVEKEGYLPEALYSDLGSLSIDASEKTATIPVEQYSRRTRNEFPVEYGPS